MTPTSRVEALAVGAKLYFSGKPCARGHVAGRYVTNYGCQRCLHEDSIARTRILRASDSDYRAARKEYFARLRENPEYVRVLRLKERTKYEQDATHRAKRLAKSASYRSRNLKRIVARNAARHAAKRQRTPSWSERCQIEEFYKNCPPGFHVDHIIPLNGAVVSGLHVLANLQYLRAVDNIRKGNSFAA